MKEKHLLIFIFLSTFLFNTLSATIKIEQVGIKTGVNAASFKLNVTDPELESQSKYGFRIGGFINLSLSKRFSIQPEVYYSQKGEKIVINDFFKDTTTFKFDYLEIPLLFKFAFISSEKLISSIYLGPYVGFKLRGVSITSHQKVEKTDKIEELSSTDYGLTVGGDLTFDLGKYNLILDYHYSLGLQNITNEENGRNLKIKNRVLSLGLGLSF
jgi:hypothetical protein